MNTNTKPSFTASITIGSQIKYTADTNSKRNPNQLSSKISGKNIKNT